MSSKKELFSRFGIASKGVVYILLSILTLLSAINAGGAHYGSKDALEYLAKQNYSVVLLSIIALGLLGFVFWRFYQGLANPEQKENDIKGIITRVSYIASGIIYALLSVYAIQLILGSQTSASSKSSNASAYIIVTFYCGLLVFSSSLKAFMKYIRPTRKNIKMI
ncbi:DUF1206 domain-containing protein [Lacinutrix neustonica]|uniref:DUF1206 domain-containing protein n=1 Tax=Lacinutrix neustonica TaxID=2980107 RepID=A0A9E8MXH4_9FLAO|nr:DUF1206 domain-containing protein [Lacinutrix neustonica]WAC03478.1 DUF1206 domain-containing protein [Lacinutrix neustonica]